MFSQSRIVIHLVIDIDGSFNNVGSLYAGRVSPGQPQLDGTQQGYAYEEPQESESVMMPQQLPEPDVEPGSQYSLPSTQVPRENRCHGSQEVQVGLQHGDSSNHTRKPVSVVMGQLFCMFSRRVIVDVLF